MVADIVEEATEEEIVARCLEMDVQYLASLESLSAEMAVDIQMTLALAKEIVDRKAPPPAPTPDPIFGAVQKVMAA